MDQQLKPFSSYVRLVASGGNEVPVVDLSAMRSADEYDRRGLARALGAVCREIGFFLVENHGVPVDLLADAQSKINAFFLLPEPDKMSIHISKSPYHRGYFPDLEENALGNTAKDRKEGFDIALELPMNDPAVVAGKRFHGPNTWPAAMPELRPTILRLYDEWRELAGNISRLFALDLGLPTEFFIERTVKPLCQLRAAKYPPQKRVDSDEIGCGAHTDYSVVSIIWQMDLPGLQMQARSGRWIDVPSVPGTFACPLGDTIERYTNSYWAATIHRVINEQSEARHAAAFFFDLDSDVLIEPLEAFVTPENPKRFEPRTMGEHVARGFDGTFAYRAAMQQELGSEP